MSKLENLTYIAMGITGFIGLARIGMHYVARKARQRFVKFYRQKVSGWESDYLESLAMNLAVRDRKIEDDFGEKFDFHKIHQTFNPWGINLAFYLDVVNPSEKRRLYDKLADAIEKCRAKRPSCLAG